MRPNSRAVYLYQKSAIDNSSLGSPLMEIQGMKRSKAEATRIRSNKRHQKPMRELVEQLASDASARQALIAESFKQSDDDFGDWYPEIPGEWSVKSQDSLPVGLIGGRALYACDLTFENGYHHYVLVFWNRSAEAYQTLATLTAEQFTGVIRSAPEFYEAAA